MIGHEVDIEGIFKYVRTKLESSFLTFFYDEYFESS